MDFELPRGHKPLTADESPAYKDIFKRVEDQCGATPRGMRALIFCVAYTLYSKKKKEYGNRLKEEGDSSDIVDGRILAQSIQKILADNKEYDEVIKEAQSKIIALTDATSNDILTKMGGAIVDGVEKKLHESLENRVIAKIESDILQKNKTGWQKFGKYLVKSLSHAFEIVIAAIIIYLIAQTIVILGPVVGNFLESIGLKYIGNIIKELAIEPISIEPVEPTIVEEPPLKATLEGD